MVKLAPHVLVAAAMVTLACAGCASSAADRDADQGTLDTTTTLGGGLLRVVIGGKQFDLELFHVRPDHSSSPRQPCMRKLGPADYSLNWSAADGHHAVPKITIRITAIDGAPMSLWTGTEDDFCHFSTNPTLDGMSADTQFTTGGALPPGEPTPDQLRVTINGRTATVPLRHECTDAELAQDYTDRKAPCADDPMNYDMANGYSARLDIS
jgi:hypothetical protein